MRRTIDVWECDLCGHRWIPRTEKTPVQCPSRKCRSPKWNEGKSSGPEKRIRHNEDPSAPIIQPHKPESEEDPFADPEPKAKTKVLGSKSCPECFALNGMHHKTCSKRRK